MGAAFWHWQRSGRERLADHALASLAVTFVTGAVISAASLWPSMGLWERLTIASFVAWMLVTALTLLSDRVILQA